MKKKNVKKELVKSRKFKNLTPGQDRDFETLDANRMFKAYEDVEIDEKAGRAAAERSTRQLKVKKAVASKMGKIRWRHNKGAVEEVEIDEQLPVGHRQPSPGADSTASYARLQDAKRRAKAAGKDYDKLPWGDQQKYDKEELEVEGAPITNTTGVVDPKNTPLFPGERKRKVSVYIKKRRNVDGRTRDYKETVQRVQARRDASTARELEQKLNMFGVQSNPFREETKMNNKKYLQTKEGSIEAAVIQSLTTETSVNPNDARPTLTLPKKYLTSKEGSLESAVQNVMVDETLLDPKHRKAIDDYLTRSNKRLGITPDKTTTTKTKGGGILRKTTYKGKIDFDKKGEEVEMDETISGNMMQDMRTLPGPQFRQKYGMSKTAAMRPGAGITQGKSVADATREEVEDEFDYKAKKGAIAAPGSGSIAKAKKAKSSDVNKSIEQQMADARKEETDPKMYPQDRIPKGQEPRYKSGWMKGKKIPMAPKSQTKKVRMGENEEVEVDEGSKEIKKAIRMVKKGAGAMTPTHKAIEKKYPGMTKQKHVAAALQKYNEEDEVELDEFGLASLPKSAREKRRPGEKSPEARAVKGPHLTKLLTTSPAQDAREVAKQKAHIAKNKVKKEETDPNDDRGVGSQAYTDYIRSLTPGETAVKDPEAKKASSASKQTAAEKKRQITRIDDAVDPAVKAIKDAAKKDTILKIATHRADKVGQQNNSLDIAKIMASKINEEVIVGLLDMGIIKIDENKETGFTVINAPLANRENLLRMAYNIGAQILNEKDVSSDDYDHATALYKDQWKDRKIADYDKERGRDKRAKEMRADAGEDRKRMWAMSGDKWKHAQYASGEEKGKKSVSGNTPDPKDAYKKEEYDLISAASKYISISEKDLSYKERQGMSKGEFALPGQGSGPEGKQGGSYPIPDESHARNALARVSQHGSEAEKKKVRAAVAKKFPNIKIG